MQTAELDLRRQLAALVLTVCCATVIAGCGAGSSAMPTPRAPAATTVTAAAAAAPACRPDPHEGVHDPQRLTIFSPCVEIVGNVVEVQKVPADGDHTFNVRLDPAYDGMMNAQNRSDGGLHVEIVPMDQPGCTPGQPITQPTGYNNLGTCSGADVATPRVGARVRVTGPFVHDDWSGPNEIHPAWRVEILPPNTPTRTTPTNPAVTVPTTAAPAKRQVLTAHLSGRAVVGAQGAPGGAANVELSIMPGKVCWRFTRVRHVVRPTRARIHKGPAGRNGAPVLSLGKSYTSRGCATADRDRVIEPLLETPSRFYVTVTSKSLPHGAVRGQLHHASTP